MFKVRRIYVEKRQGFNVEAKLLKNYFRENLQLNNLVNVRILDRYDLQGISQEDFIRASKEVLSQPNSDYVYEEIDLDGNIFAVEYLPGQFDQRADSAAQCIQVITGKERPIVKYAKVIILEGITKEEVIKVKNNYINPVDSREATLTKPETLDMAYPERERVEIISDFISKSEEQLEEFRLEEGLAMSAEDLLFCQGYFKNAEKRNPTITEIKVIDTYWSDHCRHTTFNSIIENVEFEDGKITEEIKTTYQQYKNTRKALYSDKEKPLTLMDLATIAAKELRKSGKLKDLEISEEVNACSIIIEVVVDGKSEEWLLMFKNETHNHPTEIEPFGGASTCLGGAIRDPLSGRSYVYQAMRVTGSGDPRQKIEDTLPGKLPQRKISTEAAEGYSSYGNQIGLATGYVNEIYHPNYVAKRMEVGAVIAAVPKANVKRESPQKGDLVVLLGGRTGRDGVGGATGSSKEHTEESILQSGAEVQKGDAPTERKIQRLFRKKEVSLLIKKSNDFGAGGVSVAIGELADGLNINLDLVPVKYEGLDGTELALSESQERMAVVINREDLEKFNEYAKEENLESTVVAEVTDNRRLTMTWRGQTILDISRDFLDTNGLTQKVNAFIKEPESINYEREFKSIDLKDKWLENLEDLNVCSQKAMVEKFDSTVGACTVLMPFGGKRQLTPVEGMVAKIPVEKGITDTCSLMTYGFDPYLSSNSPYHGALYAVIHSVAKIVAMGGSYENIRLTFQEYFEKLDKEAVRWGKPLSSLLGAFRVQKELQIPAIGGKDSMSGTFEDMDVPPTLISFAVTTENVKNIISPEFKKAKSKVLLVKIKKDENNLPDFEDLKSKYETVYKAVKSGKILSAYTVGYGGMAAAISKMSLGNNIGFKSQLAIDSSWFDSSYGDLILETDENISNFIEIGSTTEEKQIEFNSFNIALEEVKNTWLKPLSSIYPLRKKEEGQIDSYSYKKGNIVKSSLTITKPKVFIPVFPGTTSEYETKRAFEKAGAETEIFVFRNLSPADLKNSIEEMSRRIEQSQIIALPGGLSVGDEPRGSGKFIAAVFRNELIKETIMEHLNNRDGLIIGISNGFQALIKLGLLPLGEITDIEDDFPALAYNNMGRHISTFVKTKVVSNLSPWLNSCKLGEVHYLPIVHGEGKFMANEKWIQQLKEKGQIATQYVDSSNNPTYDGYYNPNGSVEAIEGITSPDGRVFGKMAHTERICKDLYKNIPEIKEQLIFASGVKYFK